LDSGWRIKHSVTGLLRKRWAPSNSALLTDASSSPLRAQASAAQRER